MNACNGVALFLLLVCLAALPSPAMSAEAAFDKESVRLEGIAEDKSPVLVEMTKALIKPDFPYPDAIMLGGNKTKMPASVVTSMKVKFGDKDVNASLASYFNLGDPRTVSVEAAPGGFVIRIRGGDGADAYVATLFVGEIYEEKQILRKVVTRANSFEVIEEIKYTFTDFTWETKETPPQPEEPEYSPYK